MGENYKLYIKGLDDKMDEGIPHKHVVLLTGTPGTMKSSIAYNILYNNAKQGVKGMYLTLEQDKENFQYHLDKLGMGEQIENVLNLYDMSTVREQWDKLRKKQGAGDAKEGQSLETFKRQVETLKTALGFKLLVIDSLPVVEMMFKMTDPRDDLFYFFKWLKQLDVTTIIISEMQQDSPKFSRHDIDFLADAIIKVSLEKIDPTTAQRQIQVIKMRGVNHTTDPFTLNFKDGAFDAAKVIRSF